MHPHKTGSIKPRRTSRCLRVRGRRADFSLTTLAICLAILLSTDPGVAQTCGQNPVPILAGPIVNATNHHQYYLLGPSCWTDAEATAVSMHGHLVTINDFGEDNWIRKTFSSFGGVGRGLWIGLHDLDPTVNSTNAWNRSMEFGWSSGQTVYFYKWPSPGEPDTRPDTTEFYVEMLPPSQFCGWADKPDTTLLNGLVEVPLALEITVQPQSATVRMGSSAQLSVVADGTSAITYQWQFMGTNLPGATSTSFSIGNFQASQAGRYCVIVSNDSGSLSSDTAILAQREVVGWNYPSLDGGAVNPPDSATNVVAIACGADHSVALRGDGTVLAWGDDRYGQAHVPAYLTNVTAISAGSFSSLALERDGTLIEWGYAPAIRSNLVAISARAWHALAVETDGTVIGWSENGNDEPAAPPGLHSVASVGAGASHSLALKADGTVVAWGDNFFGQASVPAGLTSVVAIAAGDNHSLALKTDGTVVAWGNTNSGQGSVPPGLDGVVAIAAGGDLSMALRTNGMVTTWGRLGGYPQPGYGAMVAIAAGDGFSLGLLGDQAPHMTVQPASLLAEAGSAVLLGAKVVGLSPMSYQWQFNGADLPGQTRDCYPIPSVQPDDAGVYTMVASNSLGVVSSREAVLRVIPKTNHPPVLLAQTDRTLNARSQLVVTNAAIDPDAGDHLTYELIGGPGGASIDAQGVIRWTPGSADIPSRNVFTIIVTDDGLPSLSATNSFQVAVLDWAHTGPAGILAGPIINPANGHRYFLLERASWTDAESTAVAMGAHLVTIGDQEEHIWVRSTFSSYNGISRPLWIGLTDPDPAITWQNGFDVWMNHFIWASGQPITFFCWSTSGQTSFGAGRIKMCAPDPTWPSGQSEWAEEADSTPLNGVVELVPTLQIVTQPQSLSVGIGRSTSLAVTADGSGDLQYQWQFMGTNLPGATASSLNLQQVSFSQSGPYQVVVSNGQGSVVSQTAWVSVSGVLVWGLAIGGELDAPAGATNVIAVSAGGRHALALRADGTVVAWGDDSHGETDVPAGLGQVASIAAGAYFNLALKPDGSVVGWGDNSYGQLDIPPSLTNAIAIAAAQNHCLAIKADRTIAAWGAYATAPAGLSNVVSVAAGGVYDLALRADGTVVSWGGNDTWNTFAAGLTKVVAIATGDSHSLALLADGTIVAWGDNMFGQTDVPPPNATNRVAAIGAAGRHSMALRADGSVVEWGDLLGNIPRPADLHNVVAIAAGENFSLALLQDGAPHLTVQPQDQLVVLGASPSFAAKAVGSQAMTFQWQFNGKDIAGATADSYSVTNAQFDNTGIYSLAVSNALGALASRPAKLVVTPAQPVPVLMPLGLANGIFHLRASGPLGRTYLLEAASPGMTDWTTVQTNYPSVMPFDFTDNGSRNPAARFYRLQLLP